MDALADASILASEHAELMAKLKLLREEDDKDLADLVDATDPTLLSRNQQQLLDAADANLRCAALCLLDMRNWTSHLAEKCRLLATADADANVRGVAVLVLRKLHAITGDPQIEPLLAQVVLNADEQIMVRRAAFRSLLDIRGVPRYAKEWSQSLQNDFPTSADLEYARQGGS